MHREKHTSRRLELSVPVRLTPAIATKVSEAAEETGLKKSDVLRMSVERGIPVLLAQLNSDPAQP